MNILKQYVDGELQVTEYTKDGVTVSHIVKEPIQTEQMEFIEQPTTEEQILFETKYQTLLLEKMSLGGSN